MSGIVGIDCGLTGAVAYIDAEELIIYDMPVLELTVNGKKRRRIDTMKLNTVIRDLAPGHIYIERVNALPGNGAAASFSFGFGAGIVEGIVAANHLPFTYVSPMKWKAAMGTPADKDGARQRASQLLPKYAHNWDLKKFDGRAEASLIALYGFKLQA